MKIYIQLFALFIIAATLTACNAKDDLVGDFTTKENGKAEIRITKSDGKYFVALAEGQNWSKPEQLDVVQDKDCVHLFGENWKDCVEAGFNKGMFGIFKVKKGSHSKDHTFTTDYFIMMLGGADVYKL